MSVLVVGAGPTGLALALSLKRRGIDYRLVERLPQRAPHSRALAIQARTMEVFEQLGILQPFLDEAVNITGLAIHDHGRETKIDFVHVHPRLPSAVILPQDETERILEEAGAAPERGVEFLGLSGGARLRHADGREEITAADWIVGCDGAHSAVRHAAGAEFPGSRYAVKLVLADAPIAETLDARVHAWTREQPSAVFPLPRGLWRVVTFLPDDAPDPPEGSMTPFAHLPLTFGAPLWWSQFRISQRQVRSMRIGRVILAGDAAHIHSPAGGQGMNLGIQDAWALGRAIGEGDAAVDAWAAERHAIARDVLRVTDRATRVAMSDSLLVKLLRPKLMGLALSQAWVERKMERALAGLDYPPIL